MARKLKFGSPAWRKKYLKSKKRNAPKRKRAKRNAPRKRVARRRPVAKRVRRRRPVKRANPPYTRRLRVQREVFPGAGTGRLGRKEVKYAVVDEQGFVAGPYRTKAEATRKLKALKRENPALKPLTKSTGWVKARGVKIVKKGGRTQILIRK